MSACEQFLHISFQEHSTNYLIFSLCHVENKYETDTNKTVTGLWIFPIKEKKSIWEKNITFTNKKEPNKWGMKIFIWL